MHQNQQFISFALFSSSRICHLTPLQLRPVSPDPQTMCQNTPIHDQHFSWGGVGRKIRVVLTREDSGKSYHSNTRQGKVTQATNDGDTCSLCCISFRAGSSDKPKATKPTKPHLWYMLQLQDPYSTGTSSKQHGS